jgi:hypothetical protein
VVLITEVAPATERALSTSPLQSFVTRLFSVKPGESPSPRAIDRGNARFREVGMQLKLPMAAGDNQHVNNQLQIALKQ